MWALQQLKQSLTVVSIFQQASIREEAYPGRDLMHPGRGIPGTGGHPFRGKENKDGGGSLGEGTIIIKYVIK